MADLQVAYGRTDAHSLLRRTVAEYAGVDARRVVIVHECPRCGGTDHGRPEVLPAPGLRRPPYVSLARAGATALVAVTRAGPVGVDLEVVGAADGIGPVAGEPGPDPTTTWVRKEALLKATGLGLLVDPRDVRLGPPDRPPVLLDWSAPYPAPGPAQLRDLDVPGHVAAVAVLPGVRPARSSVAAGGG